MVGSRLGRMTFCALDQSSARRFAVSSGRLPQRVEKGNRRDDVDVRVVDIQVQEVRVVAVTGSLWLVAGAERRDGPVLMTQRTACITQRVPRLRGICLTAPICAARLCPSNATGQGK